MGVDSTATRCGECGTTLDESPQAAADQRQPCPRCGSLKRSFSVHLEERLTVRSKLGFKARRNGKGRPFAEGVQGDDLQRSTGRWMRLRRLIDRENDRYEETVTDPETGAVIHECIEPLSQHRGHGADRSNRD